MVNETEDGGPVAYSSHTSIDERWLLNFNISASLLERLACTTSEKGLRGETGTSHR
jgi:hypothetical protein